MKKKQFEELKLKTRSELVSLSDSLKKEIRKLHIDMNMGRVKDLNAKRKKMKERAKVLSLISLKKVEDVVKEK